MPGANLFLAADEEWMAYAERNPRIARGTRRMALANQLAPIVPATAPDATAVSLRPGMATDLAGPPGRNGRWATGDPARVPTGRYAEAALRSLGRWNAPAPRLAPGATVREALALVERVEAVFGIVYRSEAPVSRGVRDARAISMLDYLVAPAAAPVWKRFGFTPIGAAP